MKKRQARELSRNQPIVRLDVILQLDWPIEQCLLHVGVFSGGKTKSPCFHLLIHWLIKQITNTIFQGRKSLYCFAFKPIAFLPFSLLSPASLLKLPNISNFPYTFFVFFFLFHLQFGFTSQLFLVAVLSMALSLCFMNLQLRQLIPSLREFLWL